MICLRVLPECLSICALHMYFLPTEAIRFQALELQMIVSHDVDARLKSQSSGRVVSSLNYWITPSPIVQFLKWFIIVLLVIG